MKVKDLLKNIEEYRKKYPDIDEWEVYTEQPDLIAPENGMSYDEWFRRVGKTPNVFFSDKEGQWVAVDGLNETFCFNSEKEARKFVNNWNLLMETNVNEMDRSSAIIEQLEKEGWNFKYDSEGWVYRDVAGDHTLFVKDKIFTINNNY